MPFIGIIKPIRKNRIKGWGNSIYTDFSDGDWYKFTKSGITKEKMILAVCETYHTDVSEIIAFGDDHADIGMSKLYGIGTAMGNAIQEVKDIADAITISNEENGVAYLEKWII